MHAKSGIIFELSFCVNAPFICTQVIHYSLHFFRFGRRKPLLFMAPFQALSSLVICFTSNIYMFIFLRMVQSITLFFMIPSTYVISKFLLNNIKWNSIHVYYICTCIYKICYEISWYFINISIRDKCYLISKLSFSNVFHYNWGNIIQKQPAVIMRISCIFVWIHWQFYWCPL